MNAAPPPAPQPPFAVGVLMSVYAGDDAGAFNRALQSMLQQQLEAGVTLRIYLGIDGPLTPALETVIERLGPALHRVLRSPVNRGLAATLNTLIAARGDEAFFFRMDADDVSLPQRLQAQLDHLRAHPDIDIVGTDIVEVDLATGRRHVVAYLDRPENLHRFICRRPPVAHPTAAFRRSVFDRVPAYPLERGNEDIAMWFRCAALGLRFDNVHQPLLEFSVSPNFWKRRGLDKSWGEFRSYWRGILALWGANWRLVFPLLRLAVRLSPQAVTRLAYRLRPRRAVA